MSDVPNPPSSGHEELGPDSELLGRYLAGECSETETAALRRWLMSHPEAADVLARFLARLEHAAPDVSAPDAGTSWSVLAGRLRESEAASARRSPHGRQVIVAAPRRTKVRNTVVGATLAAAAVAAFVWLGPTRTTRAQTPRTYATGAGERADLLLTDGTRVRLAPGSRVRIAPDFGLERRDVSLDGEAFFEVAHDERRPFTVYAGNASARDLGTSFAVRSFAADSEVRVVVREGAVSLSGVGRLNAGDAGSLTLNGVARVRRHADVDLLLGWVDGKLLFADTPLGEVLADVQRWYGLDVRLAVPHLASLPFTGSLADLPPSGVVDQLAMTLGLRARHEGQQYVLEAVPGRTPRVRRGARAR